MPRLFEFSDINMKVVTLGLKKLKQQYELTLQPAFNHQCTGTFGRTMAIPCGHTIRDVLGLD
jgi:hypothetical protein